MPDNPKPAVIDRLFASVDNASAAVLRVAFGLVIVWEVTRYFAHGWIERYFCNPSFHFKYYGFSWVEPLSPWGMKALFVVLGLLGLLIALGLFYRIAMAAFFLGFTYVFLLEQARYLNHFYFVVLMALIMSAMPLHRAASLDAWRKPALRASSMPAWCLWLLRFQIGVAYFYGGLAKLNGDWLAGQPMGLWLSRRTDFPLIGVFFDEAWAAYAFSYGGLLFDLAIVFALMAKRTRIPAAIACLGFHLMNAWLFDIGIFPWMMIAISTIYFEPDWPRRAWRRLLGQESPQPTEPAAAPSRLVTRPAPARFIIGRWRSTWRFSCWCRCATGSTPGRRTGPRKGTCSPGT